MYFLAQFRYKGFMMFKINYKGCKLTDIPLQ